MACILFIGAEQPRLASIWHIRGIAISKRELVLSTSFVVAKSRGVAERDRVAVACELVGADLKALVVYGARVAIVCAPGVGETCVKEGSQRE